MTTPSSEATMAEQSVSEQQGIESSRDLALQIVGVVQKYMTECLADASLWKNGYCTDVATHAIDEYVAALSSTAASTAAKVREMERAEKRCHVCKGATDLCCSDCRIDLGANVYVCNASACRNAHDLKCPYQLEAQVKRLRIVKP